MHLYKGSWEKLMVAEKFADVFVVEASDRLKEDDPDGAMVSLLFAIEARLQILSIVARDTVRPLGTFSSGDKDGTG